MALQALAQVLLGIDAEEEEEQETEAVAAEHGEGLLTLAGLDLGRVLREGEPLLASTGEVKKTAAVQRIALLNFIHTLIHTHFHTQQEFCLEDARGALSREALEAQKRAILRRLGLEVQDADARRALEIGGKYVRAASLEGWMADCAAVVLTNAHMQHRRRPRRPGHPGGRPDGRSSRGSCETRAQEAEAWGDCVGGCNCCCSCCF